MRPKYLFTSTKSNTDILWRLKAAQVPRCSLVSVYDSSGFDRYRRSITAVLSLSSRQKSSNSDYRRPPQQSVRPEILNDSSANSVERGTSGGRQCGMIGSSRRGRYGSICRCCSTRHHLFTGLGTRCCTSRSTTRQGSGTCSSCKESDCNSDCSSCHFLQYSVACRRRPPIRKVSRIDWSGYSTLCKWSVQESSVSAVPVAGTQMSLALTAGPAAIFRVRPASSASACPQQSSAALRRPTFCRKAPIFQPHRTAICPPYFSFSSAATSARPVAGRRYAARQTPSATVNAQVAGGAASPLPPVTPPLVSPEAFYEGNIEEEDTRRELTGAVWTSDANLWLKLPRAAADAEGNVELVQQPPIPTDEAAPCAAAAASIVRQDGKCARSAREGQHQQRERAKEHLTSTNTGSDEAAAEEAEEGLEEETYIGEEADDLLNAFQGEWNPHPLRMRSNQRAAAATVSPGSTLLSRLALAEREALVCLPRTAEKNKENGEVVGFGGETYPSTRARRALLCRERLGTRNDDDLQRLAFDRRQVPLFSKYRGRRESPRLANRGLYQHTAAENESLDNDAGSRRRMRILDLDSVPAAVLHHSFMFLLVKHLPAEICMKVISRIATYRDIHTQLAYENLIRDLGFLLTKHYQSCTANPHSLGPAFIAYLSRIVQTISIAWSVDYIRRYGCFSKKFIAQQIERSTSPRLFDCVRYERHGGVKPLSPIITHPHRLSSYVRLLDECSAKFYMYTHLKRHGQIPMQQQLQHQIDTQERLERGETRSNIPYFQLSREKAASAPRQGSSPISALAAVPPTSESNEMERRLPRPFIAAERMLQRGGVMRNSSSCMSATRADGMQTGGRKGGVTGEGGPATHVDGSTSGARQLGGERSLDKGYKDRDSTNHIVASKRPEMYDSILAAEHLGWDYQQLLKRVVSVRSLRKEELHRKTVEGRTSAEALDGEDVDVWSEDEEDTDETELRELLADDEEIYHQMLHKYIRRGSGLTQRASFAPEQEDGEPNETHEDEVISESCERVQKDEVAREAAQGSLQKEQGVRTCYLASAPATGGEIDYLRATTPRDIPAHILTESGSVCGKLESEYNDRGHNCRSGHFLENRREQNRYESLTVRGAEPEFLPCTQLSSAASIAAEACAAATDGHHQRQENFPTWPGSSFSLDPRVGNVHAKHSTVGSTQTGERHVNAATSAGESQASHEVLRRPVEITPLLSSTASSVADTDVAGGAHEGALGAAARSSGTATVETRAALRMQNTFVVPRSWMDIGSRVQKRTDKADTTTAHALLPCSRAQDAKAQWGWKWSFTVENSDGTSTHGRLEEEGCEATRAAKERWWRTSWGRNRGFFRFRGNAYALIPGQGWKQVDAERQRLLRPKKRNCRHQLKRDRHMERKIRLRRVREEILQQYLQAEGEF